MDTSMAIHMDKKEYVKKQLEFLILKLIEKNIEMSKIIDKNIWDSIENGTKMLYELFFLLKNNSPQSEISLLENKINLNTLKIKDLCDRYAIETEELYPQNKKFNYK